VLAEKYGKTAQYFNVKNTKFAQWVEKKLGRFKIIGTDGTETFWCVTMGKGRETKHGFQWQLREELVVALRKLLMTRLIEEMRKLPSFNAYDEEYKWELINNAFGKDELEIVKCLFKQNVVDNYGYDDIFKTLCENVPKDLVTCVNALFDEKQDLDDRILTFKNTIKQLYQGDKKRLANDERTAAALLTCKFPDKYTIYKDEVYRLICQYLGYDVQKPGAKYSHFTFIINSLASEYGEEIQQLFIKDIAKYERKPLNLAVQTLFWCLKEKIKVELDMNKQFTWIPFYQELSKKLMDFRNDRQPLLDLIYANRDEFRASYLHDEGGEDDLLTDIDPFTVFGLFNRQIKYDNRIHSTQLFKDLLSINSEVPSDFEGIPVLNNLKSQFVGFKSNRAKDDIENLWTLFAKVVKCEDFENEYDKVIRQYGINVNITMALFWLRPNDYLAFDKTNQSYLKEEYEITIPSKVPNYKDYSSIIENIKKKMASNEIKEKTFYELSANANNGENTEAFDYYDEQVNVWKRRKNIVLYGAPGSGKTYDVPEFVVRLCDPNFDANNAKRDELMSRYNQLKQEKRVMFTTFHQSMDYEDWIEGLKPSVENGQVTYDVQSGIFKQLCEEANRPVVKNKQTGIAEDAVVWKVSLCGTGDNPVRKECMENSHIRIGWDGYGPIISDETDWSIHDGEGKQILDAFINKMKEGDIVMSCYSSKTIDAIGVVVGDYEYNDSFPNYKRLRKVNWLLKGINENIMEINDGKSMTLGTVYRLNSITLDKVKVLLDKYKTPSTMDDNTKPYVMVIDEMNRGNVSNVFGELITLLEPDKRKGRKNAESVVLPYSKTPFSVPDNVYIIATMNTADRSLNTLDYAIRRRFAFFATKPYELDVDGFNKELFRKVSLLFVNNYDEYVESGNDQSLPLEAADTLSEDFKPEDVWIGHSYFIMEDEDGEDITQDRLLYEIIPLLEEYVQDGVLTANAQNTIKELYEIANAE
jgi:5-methylcytosine-specific restriction enzyme B